MKKMVLLSFIFHFPIFLVCGQDSRKGEVVRNEEITKYFAVLAYPSIRNNMYNTALLDFDNDEGLKERYFDTKIQYPYDSIYLMPQFKVDSLTWAKCVRLLDNKDYKEKKYRFTSYKHRNQTYAPMRSTKFSSKRINYKKYIHIVHGYKNSKGTEYIFIQFITLKQFKRREKGYSNGLFLLDSFIRYVFIRVPE